MTALKAPLEPLLVFVNSFFLNNNDYQLITKLLLCITFVAPEKLCVIFDNKDNTLCDMNKTLLLLLFFLVRQSTIQAQHPDTSRFETAYAEIADMLDGKSTLSIKRAVFLPEWAYLDGKPDYEAYCAQIDAAAAALGQFIAANGLQHYRTGGNYALFEYFSRPYSMNDYKPFIYDFDDFSGSEDLTKIFVTKVMRTHSGQCRSLPMYYKVLAEAIGAEAHITFAPQHLFIRHRDEQNPSKWVNVELTTQSLAREIFYIENFGISADAIRNKVYLYPLSDRETVAYLLSELAANYYRKFERFDAFILKCAEKSLEYLPQNILAQQHRCNVLNIELKNYMKAHNNIPDEYAASLDRRWLEYNAALRKLGWAEMPDSIYLRLLNSVEEDLKRQDIDSLSIAKTIQPMKSTDNKSNEL